MACFLVPLAEAVAVTAIKTLLPRSAGAFMARLSWLTRLLYGGSILLAFEHLWHGEISPFFPFLTAVKDGEVAGMLEEMSTVGVSMAVLVTLVWVGMVLVAQRLEARTDTIKGALA